MRKAIGNRRFLLVLDGLEAVQRGARGEDFGKTAAPLLASILKELASGKLGTGLSLITSRLPLTDLADLRDRSVGEIPLEQRPLELARLSRVSRRPAAAQARRRDQRDGPPKGCDH